MTFPDRLTDDDLLLRIKECVLAGFVVWARLGSLRGPEERFEKEHMSRYAVLWVPDPGDNGFEPYRVAEYWKAPSGWTQNRDEHAFP